MNPKPKTYWLSRTGQSAAEGPYSPAQIQAMYAAGSITAGAIVCAHGTEDWRPAAELVAEDQSRRNLQALKARSTPPPPPGPDYEAALRNHDARTINACSRTADILVGLVILFAFVPLAGFLAWIGAGVAAVVVTVLAVIVMAKGAAGRGIVMLAGAWVLMPFLVAVGNAVGLGVMAHVGEARKVAAEREAEAPSKTRRLPDLQTAKAFARISTDAQLRDYREAWQNGDLKIDRLLTEGAMCRNGYAADPSQTIYVVGLQGQREGANWIGKIYPCGWFENGSTVLECWAVDPEVGLALKRISDAKGSGGSGY